jgi:hypothetical protein
MTSQETMLVVLILGLTGCTAPAPPAISQVAPRASAPAPDTEALKVQWLLQMSHLSNQYTERTYQCMTEMYARAFVPEGGRVNAGPICRESCKLLDQVNEMAKTGPTYVDNPQQYALGSSDVCSPKKRGKH